MSKFLALALLLCLVGGSLATNVYVGVYVGPGCTAESMEAEYALPATATCTEYTFFTQYSSLSSSNVFSTNCNSGCSTCNEPTVDLSLGDCV